MATFTTNATGGVDLAALSFPDLGTGTVTTKTATKWQVTYTNGNFDLITGTGLVFDNTGKPISGTITSWQHVLNNVVQSQISGLSISASAFNILAQINNIAGLFSGNDTVTGGAGNDTLVGGDGNDTINGGAGKDDMIGGAGDDTYIVDNANDVIVEGANAGSDTVKTSVDYSATAGVENYTYTGNGNWTFNGSGATIGINVTGGAGSDIISSGGDDATTTTSILNGGAGADHMTGGIGNDTFVVDDAGDVIEGDSGGNDTIETIFSVNLTLIAEGNIENATLAAGKANLDATGTENHDNILTGNAGNNTLDGLSGKDTMIGGAGNDTYHVDNDGDTVTEFANGGTDTVVSSISFNLSQKGANVENLTLAGQAADDLSGTGNGLNNVINGDAGDNLLSGSGGNDTLNGLAGNDTLSGGAGIDTLNGGDGNDVLDSGADADIMAGGDGNDRYLVDNVGDKVVEANTNISNGQSDEIDLVAGFATKAFSYTLAANVENLDASALAFDETLVGSSNGNVITSGSGNDTLDGKGGEDTLKGGTGDDTYILDDSDDNVVEIAGQGNDTVKTTSLFQGAFANVENYIFIGKGNWTFDGSSIFDNMQITGGAGSDVITAGGDDGSVTKIDGGAGADTMTGGFGSDTFIIDNIGDKIVNGGFNIDTAQSTITVDLTLAQFGNGTVENVKLMGAGAINAFGTSDANKLEGNGGANILDGRDGADDMIGGAGNDTYHVDNAGDKVTEAANGGTDTVISTVDFNLSTKGLNVENLTLKGQAADNLSGTGNDLANIILGDDGDNTLDGEGGADTLTGGLGDDTYILDSVGDKVTEGLNAGTDEVELVAGFAAKAFSYTIGANIEYLNASALTVSATITGNALDNNITGTSGANTLNGGAGNDYMVGGNQADTLDGGTGKDTMIGGDGNDTYIVDDINDDVQENAGQGTDTVKTSVATNGSVYDNVENYIFSGKGNWTFDASSSTEKLTITGGAGADKITGSDGGGTLDGGAGADTLIGGAGDDTFVIDNKGDQIESDAGGNNTLQTIFNIDLVADSEKYGVVFENGTLTGTAALNAVGDSSVNKLTGNAGSNTLDGGGGADIMTGGAGNDTYKVDDDGDEVHESANGGTDLVISSVSFDLSKNGTNVENLTLNGPAANDLDGTGNALNNIITGDDGDNTLDGGIGADTLIGGKGSDIYVLDNVGDKVVESGPGTDTDLVVLVDGYASKAFTYTLGATIENLQAQYLTYDATITGNALNNAITGTSGKDTLSGGAGNDTLTGGGQADILDGGTGQDAMAGGKGDDIYIVDDAGDDVQEDVNGGNDTVKTSVAGKGQLYDNVETYIFTGKGNWSLDASTSSDDLSITGGAGIDTLTGGAGRNTLNGGAGDDILTATTGRTALNGGAGNDTLTTGADEDELNGGAGADTFVYVNDGSNDHLAVGAYDSSDTVKLTGQSFIDINFLQSDNGNLWLAGAVDGDYDFDDTGKLVIDNFFNGSSGKLTVLIDADNNSLAGKDPDQSTYIFQQGRTGTNNVNTTEVLMGSDGNDVINGNGGFRDFLIGGDGNDVINGGANTAAGAIGDQLYGGDGDDTLNGFGNNDTLEGAAGNDILNGGDGVDTADYTYADGKVTVNLALGAAINDGYDTADTLISIENVIGSESSDDITGSDGDNRLTGGDGNDTLTGGLGSDVLTGGAGNDTFQFSVADVAASSGIDEITDFNFSKDTLSFDSKLDTNHDDSVVDDLLTALATTNGFVNDGKDITLTFQNGSKLKFDAINDGTIATAADFLSKIDVTSFDSQTIFGTKANALNGTDNDDILIGGAGSHTINGGKGDDVLAGGSSSDIFMVDANGGDDLIAAGGYDSSDIVTLTGSFASYDPFWDQNTHNLTLSGLDGGGVASSSVTLQDFLNGSKGKVTLQIDTGANNTLYGKDPTLSTIILEQGLTGTNNATTGELIIGTTGNDVINGNGGYYDGIYGEAGNDKITGGSGTDFFRGGDGNDTLTGLGGNDNLWGDDGYDVLDGGTGTDRADYNDAAHEVIADLAAGLALQDGAGASDVLISIENIRGSGNNDILRGDANGNVLLGLDGDDLLQGRGGNDTLTGGDGEDTFAFGAFGEGKDVITDFDGGLDKLSFAVTDTNNNGILDELEAAIAVNGVKDSGAGKDVVVTFKNGSTLTFQGVGTGSITDIADLVDDTSTQFTTFSDPTVFGTAAADKLTGTDGDNVLVGNAGNDIVSGGLGDDFLIGGVGNDVLDAGSGSDKLSGGAGSDDFRIDMTVGGNQVLITDFDRTTDKLGFHGVTDANKNGILDELTAAIAGIDDSNGAGGDVVVTFTGGDTLTFAGAGTAGGTISSIGQLVSNSTTQLHAV